MNPYDRGLMKMGEASLTVLGSIGAISPLSACDSSWPFRRICLHANSVRSSSSPHALVKRYSSLARESKLFCSVVDSELICAAVVLDILIISTATAPGRYEGASLLRQ